MEVCAMNDAIYGVPLPYTGALELYRLHRRWLTIPSLPPPNTIKQGRREERPATHLRIPLRLVILARIFHVL